MSERPKPKRRVLPVGFWPRHRVARQPLLGVVPTLLTLGNAVCGFSSIMFASRALLQPATGNELYYAALLIFFAMLFDALDGPVARLSRRASEFGAQLDSLSDAISFGVAPAFLMLQSSSVLRPRLMWVIAVMYMIGAVLRLARFNVTKDNDGSHLSFRGLPSPAAAGTVAAMVIFAPGLTELAGLQGNGVARQIGDAIAWLTRYSLPWITLAVAVLMISRLRYPHTVNELLMGRTHFYQIAWIVFAGLAVFAIHELAIPMLFLWYAGAPPIKACIRLLSRGNLFRESASAKAPGDRASG